MEVASKKGGGAALCDWVALLGTLGGVALGAFIVLKSPDPVFQLHGGILGLFSLLGAIFMAGKAFSSTETIDQNAYSDNVIKYAVVMTVVWGIVGFLVGDVIAWQLVFPALNLDLPWTTFGRLRPLHTNAVIFAFGGTALLATSFYIVQRTNRARLFGRWLPWFVFWGWQIVILMAATSYIFGVTQAREYAELEWHSDILGHSRLGRLPGHVPRNDHEAEDAHIYVANWFFLAFIVTIAMLHLGNNLAVPVSFLGTKSYSAFSGVQDAMTQWWYGHNAVGFFLTAAFLGMMYYFVPKRAERPVYSYRLSIIHFWALVFTYIWAGPHHLHYTALPDWAQTLGMTFSVILWMPSWGGMINGLMTLSGAWDKLRTDPVMRFLVVSVAFYGMSTFEGPLMSVRAVNSLSHYTDWTIGHVHSGALGWVGMISFGAVYCLVPWLWGRRGLYSQRLVEWHFWIATLGILLYITSMWVSGIMQGLMWRATDDLGILQYDFVETVKAMHSVLRHPGSAAGCSSSSAA